MATILLGSIKANAFWHGVLTLIGSYIDQRLFAPSTTGTRLDDLEVQASTYGTPINTVYGTARVAGNIIWGTNFVEHKKKSGGKGGGGTTTYSYTVSCAIGICKGPMLGISRVWADGTEITAKFKDALPTEEELLTAGYVKGFTSGAVTGNKVQYRLYLGNEEQEPDPWIEGIEGEGTSPAYRGMAYIVLKDLELADYGNRIPNFTFEVVTALRDLGAVVEDISAKAKLYETFGSKAVDVSDLIGTRIHGLSIAGDKTFRERIEQLRAVYLFDGLEEEGQIVFQRRAARNALPVPYNNLAAKEGDTSDTELFQVIRKHELELPKTYKITYTSLDKDYEQNSMAANRIVTKSAAVASETMDVIMQDGQAKALAETKLYQTWASRNQVNFSLGMWWAFLGAGKELLVDTGERIRRVQVDKASFGLPGLVQIESTELADTTYNISPRAADAEVLPSPPQTSTAVVLHILDLPRLPNDTSGKYIEYLAAAGQVYFGANLYKTLDGGESYLLVQRMDQESTVGTVSNALGPGPEDFWDWANTITVVLLSGELESRSEAAVLNGYNSAVVGDEIVQFQTAVLVDEATYQLSGLLRGRLGTEDAMSKHKAGERFVLLETEGISTVVETASDWGVARSYKYGSQIADITDASYFVEQHTSTGRIARCWSPCHLKGERDGSGNLTMTWIRRTREYSDWADYVDVPLGETTEKYEVDILRGGIVARTISTSIPSTLYSVAQQVDDFGSVQSAVRVNVYQVNELRGRGIPRGGTL